MNVSNRALCVSMAIAAVILPNVAGGLRASAAQSETAAKVAATVSPATPQVGDNTVDLMITDAAGKPLSGLKLTSQVEMTTMDMGTAHPAVKDMGNGRYRVGASFGMSGPWRVTLSAGGAKASFDFEAGAETAWKPQTVSLSVPAAKDAGGTGMAAPSPKQETPTMSGMSMPGMPKPGAPEASTAPDNMRGMKMGSSMSGMEEMTPLQMPQLKEEGSYTVTGNENWNVRTGFGKNAGMVGMMSQMMVGGSGMEGMKMPPMKMSFDQANFTEDPDDEAATSGKTAPPMSGSMPGMDMGGGMTKGGDAPATQKPLAIGAAPTPEAIPAKPLGNMSDATVPSKPTDSMPDMTMPAAHKVAPLKIAGSIGSPKSGDNVVTITVTDAMGAPVMGAKITASVAMTSMDMGTSHPVVKELGGGKYRTTATFSMAGPWRVVVKVTPPGVGTPQKASFDFNAK